MKLETYLTLFSTQAPMYIVSLSVVSLHLGGIEISFHVIFFTISFTQHLYLGSFADKVIATLISLKICRTVFVVVCCSA